VRNGQILCEKGRERGWERMRERENSSRQIWQGQKWKNNVVERGWYEKVQAHCALQQGFWLQSPPRYVPLPTHKWGAVCARCRISTISYHRAFQNLYQLVSSCTKDPKFSLKKVDMTIENKYFRDKVGWGREREGACNLKLFYRSKLVCVCNSVLVLCNIRPWIEVTSTLAYHNIVLISIKYLTMFKAIYDRNLQL
jgi:hypothetical protein